jgi:CheY-like chemotaxis protein
MFFDEWPVLLVDDEADVLSVSRLAMKNFEVYGLPLHIYTARSKAEAVQLLECKVEVGCSLALTLLDVVMENDTAGLELCDYIRNDMGNKLTQIFIRTGQPGVAPERAVVDKYDINGYFSKMEMTENKLYSVVKSAVRQYLSSGMALTTVALMNDLMAAGRSRAAVLQTLRSVSGPSFGDEHTTRWLMIDDEVLFADGNESTEALALKRRLEGLPGAALTPYGDRYAKDGEGYRMIRVAGTDTRAEATYIFRTRFAPPDNIVMLMHSLVTGVATAWQQSG